MQGGAAHVGQAKGSGGRSSVAQEGGAHVGVTPPVVPLNFGPLPEQSPLLTSATCPGGSSLLAADNELGMALKEVGLFRFLEVLQSQGVECVSDISECFTKEDLRSLGMNFVQATRALRLKPVIPRRDVIRPMEDRVTASDNVNSVTGAVQYDEHHQGSSLQGANSNIEDCDSREEDATGSQERSAIDALRHDSRSKGKAFYTAGGSVCRDGSCCREFLQALEGKLFPARRTEVEKNRASSSKQIYNYARLQQGLVAFAFDALGNFCCHSTCLSSRLGLSSATIARVHRAAIQRVEASTELLSVRDIVRRALHERALLPEDNVRTRRAFFQSALLETPGLKLDVNLQGLSGHGLMGKISNRARVREMELFKDFVKANRSSTGRTADANGRLHGAGFTFDPKIRSLRSKQTLSMKRLKAGDSTPVLSSSHTTHDQSLCGIFNSALKVVVEESGDTFTPVSPSAVCQWLKRFFGHGSPEFTTVAPHKTDACADCEQVRGDIESLQKSIERHLQQRGDMSIERGLEIKQLQEDKKDCEDYLSEHKNEASRAMDSYKSAIAGSHSRYRDMAAAFHASISEGVGASPQKRSDLAKNFAKLASGFIFNVSSDYQMDKHVPQWNCSPQPSPTYFMSKRTLFVHIFSVESLGETTGDTRFQRNRVYVREERVGGSKTSDDTISTLFELLFGRKTPITPQPKLLRTGFRFADGKIVEVKEP